MEQQVATVLESIADCYYALDGAWRFGYVNRHAEAHFGRPRHELLGRGVFEVFPQAEALLRPRYERARADGTHTRTEMLSPVTGRWVEVDVYPAGEGLSVYFRDITQRRLAAIVEGADDAIIGKTIEGQITSWNAAAERMFGYAADEAIGQSITLIIPPERLGEEHEILARLRRGEGIDHFETERVTKNGRRVPISLTISPVRDGDGHVIGASKIARDISDRKRTQEALRWSEARYRAVVEDQPDLISRFAADGTLTFANDAYCRYFGFSRDAVVGTRYTPIVHPEDLPGVEALVATQSPANPVVTIENRVVRADGAVRWTQWTNRALYDEHGRFLEYQSSGRDITDRKEQETRLRFTARASELLASSLDYASTLKQLARLAVPDLAAGCVVDLVAPDGSLERVAVAHVDAEIEALAWQLARRVRRAADHPLYRVVASGQSELCEHVTDAIRARLVPGPEYGPLLDRRWLESFMVVPLKTHGVTAGTISLAVGGGRRYGTRDVAFVEDLARRAAQAIENARLYREVETANRHKDEFLAMLAHELRNPLGVIVNALAVLERAGSPTPEPVRARAVIRRQADHLARLLDDLLDVARINSGRIALRLEAVDLRAAVDVAVEAQRPRLEAKRQQLSVVVGDEPLVVEGDTARLQQVLGNLLNNAGKYTPAGGAIWLSLSAEGAEARLRIRDSGIGLPADKLEAVFELFTQAHPTLARVEGGLGIGLTLVRRIVALHRGTVSARSDGPGRGAEFEVRLPLAGAPGPASPAPAPPPPASRRRVLVIEDNDDGRDMLATALRLDGHEVLEAATGQEGVELATRHAPQVLLIDIGLPDVDGYEVCRRLRRELAPATRLIALTGYGQPQDRERATAAGFDDHLVKPVDPDRLREVLRETAR